MDKLFENISRIKNDTLRCKSVIDTQVNSLISNIVETEIMTKDIINKMKTNIPESLSELHSNYSIIDSDHLDKLILDFIQSDNKFYVGIGKTFQLLKQVSL